MRSSLSGDDLASYVARQASAFFPDTALSAGSLTAPVRSAIDRLERCFSVVRRKYFAVDGESTFDHLHTDQYAMFLYLLANSIHRAGGDSRLAKKVYALNKALHGIDAFYEVELPEAFLFQHPVGTVLGRGRYGNYFFVYQRCSVGSSVDGAYPTIGDGVVMFGGSAIIGASTVGNNCWLSVGATVLDTDVPADSVVFGRSPNLTVKPTRRNVVRDLFQAPG